MQKEMFLDWGVLRILSVVLRHLSVKVVERVPVEFLKKAYFGLHDLELELAVNKVGGIQ